MRKALKICLGLALAAAGLSAQAQVIIPPTLVTFVGQSGGSSLPSDILSITYGVTLNSGVYTYSYILSTPSSDPLLSFTLGGPTAPAYTPSVNFANTGHTILALDGVTANSIIFGWSLSANITSDTVSYTSSYGPALDSFTVNDDDIVWTSPSLIPTPSPVPVPEASTVLAGATMLLPFGVGALRAMRKRLAAK